MEGFLLRIARNLWIDYRRRGGRVFQDAEPGDRPDHRPGPLGNVDASDRAAQLRAALARLEPATRELLELAVLQQLPYKEVGMILEIPVGTVKSRVYYSLRRLRDQLAGLAPEDEA
jgi:RNA polymerase sigma-70 factor (ECF subfamily)